MTWLKKQVKRLLIATGVVIALLCVAHTFWHPGLVIQDGHDNRNQNALWLGHGWLGADSWFTTNHRTNQPAFRAPASIHKLASLCAQNGISDVYPHLCPTQPDGSISDWDDAQVERFLNNAPHLRVIPWLGGKLDGDANISSKEWRAKFLASITKLFKSHPRLAGIHLDFEPLLSGNTAVLNLLDALRGVLPPGKLLSISAYPTPIWSYTLIHAWDEAYFRQVAARCDQMALMSYDSASRDPKLYEWFMAGWTRNSLKWTAGNAHQTRILMGVPTYDDAGDYHSARAENVRTALAGIHRGLSSWSTPPTNFQGVAVYSEWVTDDAEWQTFRENWVTR